MNLNAFGQGGNKKQKEKMAKMETVIIFKFLKFFFSIAKFRLSMETIGTAQYAHHLLRQMLLKCKKVQFFLRASSFTFCSFAYEIPRKRGEVKLP